MDRDLQQFAILCLVTIVCLILNIDAVWRAWTRLVNWCGLGDDEPRED